MSARLARARAALPTVALAAVLAACASPPIEPDDGIELVALEAGEVASDDRASGTVLWGGVILGVSNLPESTEIEVLSYPLNRVRRPQPGRPAQGRFLIVQDGYLEPLDYAVGRELTVLGQLDGTVDVQIGEARQRYARVRAEQLHLWRPGDVGERPRVSFGIGIGLDL